MKASWQLLAASTPVVIAAGHFAEKGGGLHHSPPRQQLNCGYTVGEPSSGVLE